MLSPNAKVRLTLFACLALLFWPDTGRAQPSAPQRLTSIEPALVGSPYGQPEPSFLRIDSALLFTARSAQEGLELWRSDGTAAGTFLLQDLRPLSDSSPQFIAASPRLAFFSAKDGSGKRLIWATDGTTAGTVALTGPTADNGGEGAWFPSAQKLIFEGLDEAGLEPWVSDGTAGGTHRLADLSSEPRTSYYGFQATSAGAFFFQRREGYQEALFVTDGTSPGTHELGVWDRYVGSGYLGSTQSRVFFKVLDGEQTDIWTSAGTIATTRSLRSLVPELALAANLTIVATTPSYLLLAVAQGQGGGTELWSSDGTQTGTRRLLTGAHLSSLLFNMALSEYDNPPSLLTDSAFFLWQPVAGEEALWVTDGTPAGTRPLLDLCSASCSGAARYVGETSTALVFARTLIGQPEELWASDGTMAGTHRLDTGCDSACPEHFGSQLGQVGGKLIFSANLQGSSGFWRTDGTPDGTYPLTTYDVSSREAGAESPTGNLIFFGGSREPSFVDAGELWEIRDSVDSARPLRRIFDYRPISAEFSTPAVFGSSLLFSTRFPSGLSTVWLSGGTLETTSPVFSPEPPNEGIAYTAAELDGRMLIVLAGGNASALWSLDGSPTGTRRLARFAAVPPPCTLEVLGDQAFFLAGTEAWGPAPALWASDGTEGGTRLVAPDVGASTCLHAPFATLGGDLIFLGANGLYRSDGTGGGTEQIKSLSGDTFETGYLLRVEDQVFFVATQNPASSPAIWVTDGTGPGTRSLAYAALTGDFYHWLAAVDATVYFQSFTSETGLELWRTDGTTSGTRLVMDIRPGSRSSEASDLTAARHQLFFVANDGSHGAELWVSEGTAATTRMVRDIRPGPASSTPAGLIAIGDRVVFLATDGVHGVELWISDGTSPGTHLLADLAPGPLSSNPWPLGAVGTQLYFTADDHLNSRQLWVLDLAEAPPCTTADDLCLGDGRVRLRVHWRDRRSSNEGEGVAVPFSDRTGFFWFFNPENIELVAKVLDGTPVNGHLWTFYGGLSDVEYWLEVTDLATGRSKTYHNPQREICGAGDTTSLPVPAGVALSLEGIAERVGSERAAASCTGNAGTLCLLDRFTVSVEWHNQRTGARGEGTAVQGTTKSGYFSFFNPANLELVVKMLDGTPVNGHYWFFFGALSDVEYTLHLLDTATGAERTYSNPPGELCGQAHLDVFGE